MKVYELMEKLSKVEAGKGVYFFATRREDELSVMDKEDGVNVYSVDASITCVDDDNDTHVTLCGE
jgi:hypothetical protein